MVTRIHHHIAAKNADLAVYLQEVTGFEQSRIEELLYLGALYLNKKRLSPFASVKVSEGDYLRIHSEPRRYPIDKHQWLKRIHFEHQDFVVIDKPSGIPTHPTLDNGIENCMTQVSRVCGTELLVTHRLDLPTTGLLVFAKNPSAQREINHSFAQNLSTKLYRALTLSPGPRLGLMQHWMERSKRAPKKLWLEEATDRQLCELSINKVSTLGRASEVEIELITGRTHQIRAQLAHSGYPILGDLAYGGSASELFSSQWEKVALQSCQLSFGEFSFKLDRPKEWAAN